MKLKIISDGHRSRLVNADTGEQIEGVLAVEWSHDARRGKRPVQCTIVVEDVGLEAETIAFEQPPNKTFVGIGHD